MGNGFRLTGNAHYKDVLIQSAKTLSRRFNKTAGVIRSWDHNKQKWDYPVIIDNMLNLELLFAVSKLTGDQSYYNIAVSHADNTMKNHFRKDFSTWHVVDYDSTQAGKINKKQPTRAMPMSPPGQGEKHGPFMVIRCVIVKQKIPNI
ncbi:hypothetical protein [Niabella hibiscisoli]|uniref:hypothetical protein n=1 Tax=Niabella hibiscisoli TaxID=1825928 RepID=UPI001F10038A|nr:hypothetical protein [Niabella hibiscisoli]MCH5720792.1 hypothetical protein [Niabella hibiscisoli]